LITDHDDQRWVLLDPGNASLSLWDHPPDENCPAEPNALFRKLSSLRSSISSHKALKELPLTALKDVDCNPYGLNIFLGFSGDSFYRLTAPSQAVYDKWIEALDGYDVFTDSSLPCKKDKRDGSPRLKNLPVFRDIMLRGI
jgi:hypothetical protein